MDLQMEMCVCVCVCVCLIVLDNNTVIKLENHLIQPPSRNTKDFQIKPNFWLKYLYFTWAN